MSPPLLTREDSSTSWPLARFAFVIFLILAVWGVILAAVFAAYQALA
jgi:hypothetical protein